MSQGVERLREFWRRRRQNSRLSAGRCKVCRRPLPDDAEPYSVCSLDCAQVDAW